MRCAGFRGTCGKQERRAAGFSCIDLRERDQLEDLGVDGRIILKRIPEKRDGEALSQFIWHRIGIGGGRF